MSINIVKTYPITNLNGITKISVPYGSTAVYALALDNTPEVVHVAFVEPVTPPDEETEYEEVKLLTIREEAPFTDPEEGDGFFHFIGSVAWDNGHRLHHIFEIAQMTDFSAPEWDEDKEAWAIPEVPKIDRQVLADALEAAEGKGE